MQLARKSFPCRRRRTPGSGERRRWPAPTRSRRSAPDDDVKDEAVEDVLGPHCRHRVGATALDALSRRPAAAAGAAGAGVTGGSVAADVRAAWPGPCPIRRSKPLTADTYGGSGSLWRGSSAQQGRLRQWNRSTDGPALAWATAQAVRSVVSRSVQKQAGCRCECAAHAPRLDRSRREMPVDDAVGEAPQAKPKQAVEALDRRETSRAASTPRPHDSGSGRPDSGRSRSSGRVRFRGRRRRRGEPKPQRRALSSACTSDQSWTDVGSICASSSAAMSSARSGSLGR